MLLRNEAGHGYDVGGRRMGLMRGAGEKAHTERPAKTIIIRTKYKGVSRVGQQEPTSTPRRAPRVHLGES